MSNFISLEEAVDMTTLYRKEMNEILAPPYQGQNILSICETFEKEDIEKLLSKKGCQKLRIYYGMDENSGVHAILVAVNSANEDMLPTGIASTEVVEEDILAKAPKCPVLCPPSSPLNS